MPPKKVGPSEEVIIKALTLAGYNPNPNGEVPGKRRHLVVSELVGLSRMLKESADIIPADHPKNVRRPKKKLSRRRLLELAKKARFPLKAALVARDSKALRLILEQTETIEHEMSELLVHYVTTASFVENIGPIVRYGPGATLRRKMFADQMYKIFTNPRVNLPAWTAYVRKMMQADVIDEYTIDFIEKIFEEGEEAPIKALLDLKIDEHVRKKLGQEVRVHLFGNENINPVAMVGKNFNFNATCGTMSALHIATFRKAAQNVYLLLRCGANPNIRDHMGMTPLFAYGCVSSICSLLYFKSDVQAIANNGLTVFDMLYETPVVHQFLAEIALLEALGKPIKPQIREKIYSKKVYRDLIDTCLKQLYYLSQIRLYRFKLTLYNVVVYPAEYLARTLGFYPESLKLIEKTRKVLSSHYTSRLAKTFTLTMHIWKIRDVVIRYLKPILMLHGLHGLITKRIVQHLHAGSCKALANLIRNE